MNHWKTRASLCMAITALLVAPFLAHAEDAQARLMRKMHRDLYQQHEICVLQARVALVLPQEQIQKKEQVLSELASCTAEGKSDVEKANAMIAQWFKTKPAPKVMGTWRTTWLAAYDAAALQADDTETIYLRRAIDTLKRTEKVSTQFQTAVLGAPLK